MIPRLLPEQCSAGSKRLPLCARTQRAESALTALNAALGTIASLLEAKTCSQSIAPEVVAGAPRRRGSVAVRAAAAAASAFVVVASPAAFAAESSRRAVPVPRGAAPLLRHSDRHYHREPLLSPRRQERPQECFRPLVA